MKIILYSLLGISIICLFLKLVLGAKTNKAFICLFLNSVFGLSIFLALYFSEKYTGIDLALNIYTVLGSSVFGIPGVICLLILNLLF